MVSATVSSIISETLPEATPNCRTLCLIQQPLLGSRDKHTQRQLSHNIVLVQADLILFLGIMLIVGRIMMVTICHSIQIPFIVMTLLLIQDKTENLTETMVELGFNLRNYYSL